MNIDKKEFFSSTNGCWIFASFSKKFYKDAVVMQRWEIPKEPNLKPECSESPMYYGGSRYVSFIVNIPKPPRAECTGTVIVMRTSKNRYKAAMDNGKAVTIQSFTTLKQLELYCEKFFR